MHQAELVQQPLSCLQLGRMLDGDPTFPSITKDEPTDAIFPLLIVSSNRQLWELYSIFWNTTTSLTKNLQKSYQSLYFKW